MVVAVFDLSTIFWATLLDVIIDIVVFKLFRVRGITVVITAILNFFIPYLSFWFFVRSSPPFEQQVSALADFIANSMVNFVNFTLSAIFGYITAAIIFIISGGRTPEPEL